MNGQQGAEDGDLSDRIRLGDESAIEELLRSRGPNVVTFLLKWGLSPEDAEEILSSAAAWLWFNINKYDPEKSSLPNYFSVVSLGLAKSFLRSRSRKVEMQLRRLPLSAVPGGAGTDQEPEEPALPPELQAALDAFAQLSPREQRILLEGTSGDADWAARLARELGVNAVKLRVEKLRLLQRLGRKPAPPFAPPHGPSLPARTFHPRDSEP